MLLLKLNFTEVWFDKMVTIIDIAKATGVSPSTVSRVIADNPRISIKTKEKVRKAMKEMSYHPNINARNLASRSTKSIGVIMPSSADKALQNPFFPEILRGIGSVTYNEGFSMTLSSGTTEEEMLTEVERMVYGSYIDGVILLYSRVDDPIMDFLLKERFPFIIVGKPFKNNNSITNVDTDNFLAGKEITEHLIEQGHEKIAFVGGEAELFVTIDRKAGYESALKEANLLNPSEYIVHAEFLKSGGRKAIDHLLSLPSPPTGLVVSDDLMSLGIISALDKYGYDIPTDISIVSFNNVYLSEITKPALTTVDINIYELGAQSAKALIEKALTKKERAKSIIVPHKVIYRDSVAKKA